MKLLVPLWIIAVIATLLFIFDRTIRMTLENNQRIANLEERERKLEQRVARMAHSPTEGKARD